MRLASASFAAFSARRMSLRLEKSLTIAPCAREEHCAGPSGQVGTNGFLDFGDRHPERGQDFHTNKAVVSWDVVDGFVLLELSHPWIILWTRFWPPPTSMLAAFAPA